MRTIKAEQLTREAFAPFGTFYSMTEPEGYSLNGEIHRFFRTGLRSLIRPVWRFLRFW